MLPWVSKKAQFKKKKNHTALAIRPDDSSLTPGAHNVGSDLYAAPMYTSAHTNTHGWMEKLDRQQTVRQTDKGDS